MHQPPASSVAATVCGRRRPGTEISCGGRRFGQRLHGFNPPGSGRPFGSPLSKGVSTTNTHQKSRGNVSREAHTGDTLVETLFGIIPLLGPFSVSSI